MDTHSQLMLAGGTLLRPGAASVARRAGGFAPTPVYWIPTGNGLTQYHAAMQQEPVFYIYWSHTGMGRVFDFSRAGMVWWYGKVVWMV